MKKNKAIILLSVNFILARIIYKLFGMNNSAVLYITIFNSFFPLAVFAQNIKDIFKK